MVENQKSNQKDFWLSCFSSLISLFHNQSCLNPNQILNYRAINLINQAALKHKWR